MVVLGVVLSPAFVQGSAAGAPSPVTGHVRSAVEGDAEEDAEVEVVVVVVASSGVSVECNVTVGSGIPPRGALNLSKWSTSMTMCPEGALDSGKCTAPGAHVIV